MNRLLINNSAKYRLLRTILQDDYFEGHIE